MMSLSVQNIFHVFLYCYYHPLTNSVKVMCSQVPVYPWGGLHPWGSLSGRESLSRWLSVQGKSLSRGSLSPAGLSPRESLSKGVSVQGVSVQKGVSVQGVFVQLDLCLGGSVQGESLSIESLCLGGVSDQWGLCPGISLSRGSLSRGVSVQGGLCLGSLSARQCTVMCGQYASYWNAFLLRRF